MNVGKLINLLRSFPDDMEVRFANYDYGATETLTVVKKVSESNYNDPTIETFVRLDSF